MNLGKKQLAKLQEATRLDKDVVFKYPGVRVPWRGKVVGEVSLLVEPYKYVIQKIELGKNHHDGSRFSYRFGYYAYSSTLKRVVWVPRALVATSKEWTKLVSKAREEGWEEFDMNSVKTKER